jgi:drug/metabolite transporter (DMT)-like permease
MIRPKRARETSGEAGAEARLAWLYLAFMIISWAANWPLMKLALGQMRPMVFLAWRMTGSVVVLALYLVLTGQRLLPVRRERHPLFWVGQFQVIGFLVLSIIALAIVPAGRGIVLAYTMPLWAIPIGLLLAPEPLSGSKIAGVAVGLCGLALFMKPGLVDWTDARSLIGNGLLLLAAISWAIGSCLYRRQVWISSFWSQTWWQLAVGGAVSLLLALVLEPDWSVVWTPGLVAILAYNWVVTTALGYFLWSRVLALMTPAVAGQAVTLTPVAGFALSTAMFGGALPPTSSSASD